MELERRMRFDVGDVSVEEGWVCCFCCAATTCALVGMSKGIPVCDIANRYLGFEDRLKLPRWHKIFGYGVTGVLSRLILGGTRRSRCRFVGKREDHRCYCHSCSCVITRHQQQHATGIRSRQSIIYLRIAVGCAPSYGGSKFCRCSQ